MSEKSIRYGEFVSAVRHRQRFVSYNLVFAYDRSKPRRTQLRAVDVHRLVTPYVTIRFLDQLRAVVPLALMLYLFQMAVLRVTGAEVSGIAFGIFAVIIGLMFFMEGVKHGLMPFAENIGFSLPNAASQRTVLAVALILGALATVAEPAIGALQAAGASVRQSAAPLLHMLLTTHAGWLVTAVALGVGIAVVLGMLRFYFGWSLKVLIFCLVLPALGLSLYAGLSPQLAPILGLAWDCGAITTGPVTVPLVLALGIGVSAAAGKGDNPLSGFGIVTLASLIPAIAVLGTAILLRSEAAGLPTEVALPVESWWFERPPFADAVAAARAILPLVAFLWLVQTFIARQQLRHRMIVAYGVVLAVLGMWLFNVGLSNGLVPLGDQAGNNVPAAFTAFAEVPKSPLYPYAVGIALALAFAACLGYFSTVAEPALNAMGLTVEDLTDGAFRRELLVQAVAVGVGAGTLLGVARIIFGWPILPLLLAAYSLALTLTLLSSEEYVNLAWDSAGVTTGPVTVPLILALGLGLGKAVGAVEGFGILSMASAGPIVSVLAVGLWIRRQSKKEDLEEGELE